MAEDSCDEDAGSSTTDVSDAGAMDSGIARDAGSAVCGLITVARVDSDSCDLILNTTVKADVACTGAVSLNGNILQCGGDNGWSLVDPNHIRLAGTACDAFQGQGDVLVTADFPCGARSDCTCG
jgi:hypothetical protein